MNLSLLWRWIIIAMCFILLFLTYQMWLTSNTIIKLNNKIEQYEPILNQIKQIQDEVRFEIWEEEE
jgi:cell division protein FtsL